MAKGNEQTQRLLARLGAERLATELMHLADYDRTIARRVKLLAKEADPKGLAAELGRRIGGLRRSSRFVHYRESFALALELAELVEAIANKVVPVDPERGFDLADAFLSTDDKTYGRVDDSSGSVADVYRAACDTWLRAAAGSNREQDWVARLYETATQNDYGVREPLLSHADLLLSEHELRRLAKRFECEAIAAAACPDDSGGILFCDK